MMVVSAVLARGMMAVAVLDMPGGRKAHARPTPKGGGVGVIGAVVLSAILFPPMRAPWMLTGLAAAVGLGLMGWADDVRDRGAVAKLLAQVLAALVVVAVAPMPSGMKPLAALWLVGITNVFNFMDGLDGLAGGAGLIAALAVALAAPMGHATQIAALALAAGLVGFLPFNLPPARIFLGDVGSQFCGFLFGLLGLWLAADPLVAGGGWLVPMLLSGMIFDVALTLARRAWAGAPLASAHREHLYQRMRLPAWQVSVAHAGFAAIGAAAWLAACRPDVPAALLILGVPQAGWLAVASLRGRSVRI